MTRELAHHSRRVVAIELDQPLVEHLKQLATEARNIEVVAGDVLAVNLRQAANAERFHVYGSLPYYITSPILRRLFEFAGSIASIHVVIQFEVAARLVAKPGRRDYGFLTVLTQFYSKPEIALRIPPGAFRPPPKVASALVNLRLREDRAAFGIQSEAVFLEFVGRCFEQKRKTLLNNLKFLWGAERAQAALRAADLRPDARAEQLTLEQFATLFKLVSEKL
jgi:16S rRNA (adenine1518-N6/adenine1519-N6)-dimethyltransferase